MGGGITKELRNEISRLRNKLDATRRELADHGLIGREFRRVEAIEQAVGIERNPDAWLN